MRAFRQAEGALVLLSNADDLIPLRGLDTLRIAAIGFGMDAGCAFPATLDKYTRVQHLSPPRPGGESLDAWLSAVDSSSDLVIIGIDERRGVPSGHLPLLRALSAAQPNITVLFGVGRMLVEEATLAYSEALVVTPGHPDSYTLAAQLLFGGVGARGKLPAAIGTRFPAGAGLRTQGGLRLRYSPPEVVGMDRRLLVDSIRAIVEEGIARGAYPGAQVVVAKDGHVVFEEAFGHHTYDSLRSVALTDLYDYASMTKITGALPAVMKLYGEGRFDLDAPLKRYLPEFRRSNKADLSYRAMLAHQARLRPWVPYWQGTLRGNARYPWKKKWDAGRINDYRFRNYTLKRDSSRRFPIRISDDLWLHRRFKERHIYRAIKRSPLNEEPGYVYSGLLFYLLPEIVSELTGEDFEPHLKKHFYHPIGAHSITFNPMKLFPVDRIVPTERDTFFRMQQLHGVVHDEGAAMMGGVSSNAGLFSTANDLAKLMQLYLNEGRYGGEQLIPAAAVQEFTRCQYPKEGNRRGLGFDKPLLEYDAAGSYVAKSASPESFGHSGYTGTFAWADPQEELLLVFFSNRVYPTRNNRKLYTLNIRPRLHQACYDAIGRESVE